MNRGKNRKITLAMVYDKANLELAFKNAKKGKPNHYGILKFEKNYSANIERLHEELKNETFKVGAPKLLTALCDRKIRTLAKVHFEKHVVFHALMQVTMPVFAKLIYVDASSSLKGKGIHYTVKRLRNYLNRNKDKTLYWVKIDYVKYYHHINRRILYRTICKLFNDKGIRRLFYEVIYSLGNHNGLYLSDGTEGVGIGMYPSQTLINLYPKLQDYYLSTIKVRVFRYSDDVLLISDSIENLKKAIKYIIEKSHEINSPIHENIGIQLLDDKHPINFIGYKFYKTYMKLRDNMKYRFKYKIKHTTNLQATLGAYKGWFIYCKAKHLWYIITGLKSYNIKKHENTKRFKKAFDRKGD